MWDETVYDLPLSVMVGNKLRGNKVYERGHDYLENHMPADSSVVTS